MESEVKLTPRKIENQIKKYCRSRRIFIYRNYQNKRLRIEHKDQSITIEVSSVSCSKEVENGLYWYVATFEDFVDKFNLLIEVLNFYDK